MNLDQLLGHCFGANKRNLRILFQNLANHKSSLLGKYAVKEDTQIVTEFTTKSNEDAKIDL